MKVRYSPTPLSVFQAGSDAVLSTCPLIKPTALSSPAGFRTVPIEDEKEETIWRGFQPISCTLLMAWAANFGVARLTKTSAPEAFRRMTWDSTVGAETS